MIAATIIDCARAAGIAIVATLAAAALDGLRGRRVLWLGLAAWLLVPALAVGWAWAVLPWAPLRAPWAATTLHLALAALRLAPLALAVAWLDRPPVDRAGLHALRLAGHATWWAWLRHGPGRRWLLAALVVFAPALAEFEIGARLGVDAWATRLFDAQAGGLPLTATILRAAPGVGAQALVLALAWRIGRRRGEESATGERGRGQRALGVVVLLAGSVVLVVLPLATALRGAVGGWNAVANRSAWSEVAATMGVAATAALCTWLLAGRLLTDRRRSGRTGSVVLSAMLLPGLCGPLVIGLGVLAAVQTPALAWAAATPLPLVAALILSALPFVLPARALAEAAATSPAAHIAGLVGDDVAQRRTALALRWHLVGRAHWLAWSVGLWCCACDLAASAILHPVGMTPVLVRLYHFMHYGQSAALSARLVLAMLVPLLVALVVGACWRWRWTMTRMDAPRG